MAEGAALRAYQQPGSLSALLWVVSDITNEFREVLNKLDADEPLPERVVFYHQRTIWKLEKIPPPLPDELSACYATSARDIVWEPSDLSAAGFAKFVEGSPVGELTSLMHRAGFTLAGGALADIARRNIHVNDLDFYFVGEASAAEGHFRGALKQLSEAFPGCKFYYTELCISVVFPAELQIPFMVQIVNQVYSSALQLVFSFDQAPGGLAWGPSNEVVATFGAVVAHKIGVFMPDISQWRKTFNLRVVKYMCKGYLLLIPFVSDATQLKYLNLITFDAGCTHNFVPFPQIRTQLIPEVLGVYGELSSKFDYTNPKYILVHNIAQAVYVTGDDDTYFVMEICADDIDELQQVKIVGADCVKQTLGEMVKTDTFADLLNLELMSKILADLDRRRYLSHVTDPAEYVRLTQLVHWAMLRRHPLTNEDQSKFEDELAEASDLITTLMNRDKPERLSNPQPWKIIVYSDIAGWFGAPPRAPDAEMTKMKRLYLELWANSETMSVEFPKYWADDLLQAPSAD